MCDVTSYVTPTMSSLMPLEVNFRLLVAVWEPVVRLDGSAPV
jgi:hypothetical protein